MPFKLCMRCGKTQRYATQVQAAPAGVNFATLMSHILKLMGLVRVVYVYT